MPELIAHYRVAALTEVPDDAPVGSGIIEWTFLCRDEAFAKRQGLLEAGCYTDVLVLAGRVVTTIVYQTVTEGF